MVLHAHFVMKRWLFLGQELESESKKMKTALGNISKAHCKLPFMNGKKKNSYKA